MHVHDLELAVVLVYFLVELLQHRFELDARTGPASSEVQTDEFFEVQEFVSVPGCVGMVDKLVAHQLSEVLYGLE